MADTKAAQKPTLASDKVRHRRGNKTAAHRMISEDQAIAPAKGLTAYVN